MKLSDFLRQFIYVYVPASVAVPWFGYSFPLTSKKDMRAIFSRLPRLDRSRLAYLFGPKGLTFIVQMSINTMLLSFFLLLPPSWQVAQSGTLTTVKRPVLDGAYGIRFGTARENIVRSMSDEYGMKPVQRTSRGNYAVLEFPPIPEKDISKLRVFVNSGNGVFWIEEEIGVRWNLQRRDQDNLEYHEKKLEGVLHRLRSEYGRETIIEDADMGDHATKNDFVTATWTFAENRWIHVIYEPQDWGLFPERIKIVVIYRDSNLDPRRK